ncbi:Retrovirus-related Pol polyprotein from transposon TNT 1-94 [Araneus ventricosus]|uniref:Retrovirus-related Pol polyprotein from transposon TNT 1-94 n=1 Tax=Araneus ventricosus TaxID=182803 RepID=A0A4Y2BT75_ARAVE|nr:Retrovirus-related Pol polyprotein from transposon TNT 1-94 [Araneus ventricosus]
MDAELKYYVDQFDGANFAVCSRRIESIFVAKNLDKFLSKEADETKENEVSSSKKAYALMLSFLGDKVLLSLSDENTCASIFQKLKSTYLRDGAVNQILIRKRLAMLKKKKDVSMQEHLNEVNGLVNQLKSCGVKISDMDIIVYILMSLPPEYDSTKSPIENQPSEQVSLQFVVSRLLDAEALLKDRRVSETKAPRSESSNDIVFPTNQRTVVCFKCNKKGHIARFCDKTVVCHHCGKLGHKKRNCRYLTRKKTPFKEEEAAAVSFVVGEGDVEKFIVDSGATSHMCSHANVKQIQKAGYSVLFKDNKAIVKGKNKTFVLCELNSKGQYVSDFIPTVSNTFVAETEEAELWHRRLGHSGNHALRKLVLPTSDSFCENCVLSKQSAEPIEKGNRRRENAPMRMIHSDLCGPVEPAALSGERYVLTFVDDYSRFCEVRLIKKKSDIAVEFKKFLKVNDTVKRIRCDNAKEYVSGELQNVARNAGVEIDPCPPYTPQLNGVAERMNRTLFDKVRAMLYDSKLPKSCWGYAIQTAAFLHNRIPCTSINDCTPYELKYSTKPDLTRFMDSSMGYRVMDPVTRRVTVSRNVRFVEKKIISDKLAATPNIENQEDTSDLGEETETDIKLEETERAIDDKYPEFRRSQRERKPPLRYPFNEALSATNEELTFDGIKFLPDEEQSNWKSAMDEEMLSTEKNKVWDLVELSEKEKQPITCKWIFKRKRDGKYKARLVARGLMQREGVDYTETFSPVISMPSLRLVLVLILQENLHSYVMDVKTAFLNGDLDEVVYLSQPQGYDEGTRKVCKLNKSLYGLKQAPRQWFHKFQQFMNKVKFKQSTSDPCIFIRKEKGRKIIICLYVDDLLIAGSDPDEVETVINLLQKEFEMSKSAPATEFLGIKLVFTPTELKLDQEEYIDKTLKHFNMSDCKPCSTPLEPKCTSADFANSELFEGPSRELIGSLLYLAVTIRPDILFSVNCLSQLQEKPTVAAWTGLKRILRYLKGTKNFKLVYKKLHNPNFNIDLYVDADWASDTIDRKSVSGYVLMFCNCPILWCCKKENCISLSSTEAEIIALMKSVIGGYSLIDDDPVEQLRKHIVEPEPEVRNSRAISRRYPDPKLSQNACSGNYIPSAC